MRNTVCEEAAHWYTLEATRFINKFVKSFSQKFQKIDFKVEFVQFYACNLILTRDFLILSMDRSVGTATNGTLNWNASCKLKAIKIFSFIIQKSFEPYLNIGFSGIKSYKFVSYSSRIPSHAIYKISVIPIFRVNTTEK